MKPIRILVVDDDAAVGDTVAQAVEMLGYRAEVAGSGREALAKCDRDGRFGLVLADMKMPEIGGLQLAEMLGARFPRLPVVLMSGRDSMADTAIAAGSLALIKPFTVDELQHVLDDVFER